MKPVKIIKLKMPGEGAILTPWGIFSKEEISESELPTMPIKPVWKIEEEEVDEARTRRSY